MAFSPELEVEIRIKKSLTKEEKEQFDVDRIIGKVTDEEDYVEDNADYRRMRIRLDRIIYIGDFDGRHSVVGFTEGSFIINTPYDQFGFIYDAIMGTSCKKISDFKFTDE